MWPKLPDDATPFRGGYHVIVGGVLLHLTLGTLYLFGSIQPYVASYLRLHDPSVTLEDTTLIYTVTNVGLAIFMPLVGLLQFRIGLRGCAAVGAGLVGCSTLASSAATTLEGFVALGFMFGVGMALAYTCPLVSGYAWMPGHKGMVSGFVVAGFGSGAAVFNIVAILWVNPNDASPDPTTGYFSEEVAKRVPGMYLILGSSYLALGMFGSWLLSPPPASATGIVAGYESLDKVSSSISDEATRKIGEPLQLHGDGEDCGDVVSEQEEVAEACGNRGAPSTLRQYDCLELVKELDTYFLALIMLLISVPGLFIAGNYKRIAQWYFPDADRFLSVLGSVASLFNGAGRIIFGLALDRFGCFATLLVMSVTTSVLLLALSLNTLTKPFLFLAVCLLLLLYGGNFATYPALTANMFGATTAGPNYGFVFMLFGVSSFFVMMWLSKLVTINSSEVFMTCSVLSSAGAVSVASLWTRRRRRGLPM
ncbi:unnamed protein product [Ascophyllum nodosum]